MSPKENTLPKARATATTLNISAYAASEDAPQVQDLASKSKGKSHQQAPITSIMPTEKPQSKSLLLKPPPKIKEQKHAAKMSVPTSSPASFTTYTHCRICSTYGACCVSTKCSPTRTASTVSTPGFLSEMSHA